jgi:hypothetical protein
MLEWLKSTPVYEPTNSAGGRPASAAIARGTLPAFVRLTNAAPAATADSDVMPHTPAFIGDRGLKMRSI